MNSRIVTVNFLTLEAFTVVAAMRETNRTEPCEFVTFLEVQERRAPLFRTRLRLSYPNRSGYGTTFPKISRPKFVHPAFSPLRRDT